MHKADMHKHLFKIGENCTLSLEERQKSAARRWSRASRSQTKLLLKHFNSGTPVATAQLTRNK
jgi:hypothetical protein